MTTKLGLPEHLQRRAEAAAAESCTLQDWLVRAIEASAAAHEKAARAAAASEAALAAYTSRLQLPPDGTLFNPAGIEDESFFQALEDIRARRIA